MAKRSLSLNIPKNSSLEHNHDHHKDVKTPDADDKMPEDIFDNDVIPKTAEGDVTGKSKKQQV